MIFLIVAIVIRLTIILGLAWVVSKQLRSLKYRASRGVHRLRVLLVALTLSILLINATTELPTLAALFCKDFALTIQTAGDAIYVTSRLLGDIIVAGLIYLIYREA